jgi:anti-sigma28 factor (negative regulator of flagellin synthesis)
MRIDLNNNILINGVEREGETRKARGKPPSAPNVEDKTSLSSDTLSVSSLTTQAMGAPSVRQDRVEARQQVQNREYKLEAGKTAHAILQQNKRAE